MTDATIKLLAQDGAYWAMDAARAKPYLLAAESQPDRVAARRLPKVTGGIAVVPVYGILTKRGGFFATSTDGLSRMVETAAASPRIGAIVLDVDSPGGSVVGLPEFADAVYSVRGVKPVIGVANALAASAAYWSITSADQVVVTPSGDVGSVGVYSMHLDFSEALRKEGIAVSLVYAGKYKVEGNPFEPLDAEARAELQRRVDLVYAQFISALSRNRNIPRSVVRDTFGEGRIVPAASAVRLGMADQTDTLDSVLRRMRGRDSASDESATALLLAAMKGEAATGRRYSYAAGQCRRRRLMSCKKS
jgi:signal peptide peptidase SppA